MVIYEWLCHRALVILSALWLCAFCRGLAHFPFSLLPLTILSMSFRLQATHLFLTYPQCPLDFDVVYNHLLNLKFNDNCVQLLCLGRELHEDGNPHYHAYLKYERKLNLRNPNFFDIQLFHPNIQKCKSTNDTLKYVTKDGDFRANFELKIKYTLSECLERAVDENDFIRLGLQSMDWKFGASFSNLIKLYREKQKEKNLVVWNPLFNYSDFVIMDFDLLCGISGILTHVKDGTRTKSLWLYGPSRTGKTALARSLGVHAYMHEIWNADNLSDEATYTVYDDFSWEVLKRQYKSILGCMKDITVTDKYRSKKNLVYNMPAIVLSNEKPLFTLEENTWLEKKRYFCKYIK